MLTVDRLAFNLRARSAWARTIEWMQPNPLAPGFWCVEVVPPRGEVEVQHHADLAEAFERALVFVPCPRPAVPVPIADESLSVNELGAVLRESGIALRDLKYSPRSGLWQITASRRLFSYIGTGEHLVVAIETTLAMLEDADLLGRLEHARLQAERRAILDSRDTADLGGEGA